MADWLTSARWVGMGKGRKLARLALLLGTCACSPEIAKTPPTEGAPSAPGAAAGEPRWGSRTAAAQPSTSTSTSAPSPAPPSTSALPEAAVDAAPPAAASSQPLTVERISGTNVAPNAFGQPPVPPTISASAERRAVKIKLVNVRTYCAPAPRFAARLAGDSIELTLLPPEPPVARCVGPHSAVFRVRKIPAGTYRVVLRTEEEVTKSDPVVVSP